MMKSNSCSRKGSVWKRKKVGMGTEPESVIDSRSEEKKTNKKKKYELLSFDELPEYMKDNEYILGYYRADWPIKQALFSLFRWHNETLNVWT